MTLQEVCEKYELAESTVKCSFKKAQKSILRRYDLKLTKEGRGKDVVYSVIPVEQRKKLAEFDQEKESITLYDKTTEKMDWGFLVFLVLTTSSMLVYRGCYEDFFGYAGIPFSNENVQLLKDSLCNLRDRGFIYYTVDESDENYFCASITREKEVSMDINLKTINACKDLAKKNNKKSWVPLWKLWIGIQMLDESQLYSIDTLCGLTGLPYYQVNVCNETLKQSAFYRVSNAYACYKRCVGNVLEYKYTKMFKEKDE